MAEVASSPSIAYAFMSSSCQEDWNQASYYGYTLVISSLSGMLVPYISWSSIQKCSGQKQSNANDKKTLEIKSKYYFWNVG